MERLIVASVQQRIRVFATLDNYRSELQRFLRIAQHKHAALVIFPELGATMLVPPMLRDTRVALLKYAEAGRRRKAPLWQRYSSTLSARLAAFLPATFAQTIGGYLAVTGSALWQTYCDFFGELAKQANVTIVAPSGYLPDPSDGVVRNISGVFGPDGSLLGYQAKVMLHQQDRALAESGSDWDVIQTEAGAIGILIGNDVLYPEIGRLLAYKGAEILVGQGACAATVLYQKLRSGLLARMQDNQLFAAASFLVGKNDLAGQANLQYVGRSAIFAPQELTPRFNGVLVEMGSPSSEGVLSADWNYVALRKLWDLSDTPLRKEVPFKHVGRVIASLYARLQHAPDLLEENSWSADTSSEQGLLTSSMGILRLDELPVTTTITRRWPPNKVDYSAVDLLTAEMPELAQFSGTTTPPERTRSPYEESVSHSAAEDETEEMDVLSELRSDENREQNQ